MRPIEYAKASIETMMRTYEAAKLPPQGRFHYHQGVFLSGVYKTYELCGEEKYAQYVKDWVDSVITPQGDIKSADMGQFDDMQPGILLYPLYQRTGDGKYKKVLDHLMNAIDTYPTTPEGGYFHKAWCPQEMWLDGLYMEGPLRAQYGAEFNRPEYFNEVIFQALTMQKHTKDAKTGLMYHAWSYDKKAEWADPETGCSPEFWGRAIGWVPVALLDELDFIPLKHSGRKELEEMAVDLLKCLVVFQSEEGRWYQVVDKGADPGNWLENSCSCLYVAALCKAVRKGLLDRGYLKYARKGYEAVINSLTWKGIDLLVGDVCIGTGVGDYDHYIHRPVSTNDLHGVGAFLLMCEEMEQVIGESFPDGTPIDRWFFDTRIPTLQELGTQYKLTDYEILDDGKIHTKEIQQLIDAVAAKGGGVIIVPAGTYLTGALFFRQGVNLYIEKGGVLKGSDDILDYPLIETRMEGQTCLYFAALINADGIDGFTMCGDGTIDGNGLRSWKAFWLRRKWNPDCTNKDEQRPRLVYLSHCSNVLVAGLNLQNAHFWTNHLYQCDHVKYLNCRIYSPAAPIKAPSTDAIDIDVCHDVLVKNCYLEVNDDSIVLKGGKGPWADTAPDNGINERVLVEDCIYGFCHGCLTCGSESVHNKNIIVRRIKVLDGNNLLWLKMRPDTPQHYEYILMEDIQGRITNFININPWTQFYDLQDRKDIPMSYADHVTMRNCNITCDTFYDVQSKPDQYALSDFIFENLQIHAARVGDDYEKAEYLHKKDVEIIITNTRKEREEQKSEEPWNYRC